MCAHCQCLVCLLRDEHDVRVYEFDRKWKVHQKTEGKEPRAGSIKKSRRDSSIPAPRERPPPPPSLSPRPVQPESGVFNIGVTTRLCAPPKI